MEQQIIDLLEKAKEELNHARLFEAQAANAREAAMSFKSQAAELVAPFKVGDIIEFIDFRGYGAKRKGVTLRMKVMRMDISGDKVTASGFQVNKDNQSSGRESYFGGDCQFVRVV